MLLQARGLSWRRSAARDRDRERSIATGHGMARGPDGSAQGAGWASWLVLQATILALWLGTFLFARVLEHAPHASLWFPPAAVTFAALLVVGRRALPALVVACVAATYFAELQYSPAVRIPVLAWSSVAFTAVHVLAYGLPAMMLRADARRRAFDVTLRSVARFMLLGVAGAGLAAVGGAVALSATGLMEAPSLGRVIIAWWMGDFAALITLSPLLIRWMVRLAGASGAHAASRVSPFEIDPTPPSPAAVRKLASMGAVTVATLAAAYIADGRELGLAVLVLPLLLQMWVVHTESRTAALQGVVLFGLLTVGMGALFADGVDPVTLQFAAIGLAANTYLGLAVPALYASNALLREQVTRDRLTRVMSRAYFEERAGQELERAVAGGRQAAVVLLDLDRLKSINDTHGHAVGDAVLIELAARCAASLRPGDFIGRLSGDEFAVFLPEAGAIEAGAVIERMRASLESTPFAGPAGAVSASFGHALRGDRVQLADLLRDADDAMYRDKRR